MSRHARKQGAGRKRRERKKRRTSYSKSAQGVSKITPGPLESTHSDHLMTDQHFKTGFEFTKVDEDLGVIFGWALVSKQDGEDYYDLQGHNITEEAAVEASIDFMLTSQVQKDMHKGKRRGTAVMFPMTSEIADAYGFDTGGRSGVMVMSKPDPDLFQLHKEGKRRGFSIAGFADRKGIEEME